MTDLMTKATKAPKASLLPSERRKKWDEWCSVSKKLISKGYSFIAIEAWMKEQGEPIPKSFTTLLSRELKSRGISVLAIKGRVSCQP